MPAHIVRTATAHLATAKGRAHAWPTVGSGHGVAGEIGASNVAVSRKARVQRNQWSGGDDQEREDRGLLSFMRLPVLQRERCLCGSRDRFRGVGFVFVRIVPATKRTPRRNHSHRGNTTASPRNAVSTRGSPTRWRAAVPGADGRGRRRRHGGLPPPRLRPSVTRDWPAWAYKAHTA